MPKVVIGEFSINDLQFSLFSIQWLGLFAIPSCLTLLKKAFRFQALPSRACSRGGGRKGFLVSAHPQIQICQSMTFGGAVSGVRSEMVDFGPRQGRTRVFAAGVAGLRRGRKLAENAASGQNMPFMDGHQLGRDNLSGLGGVSYANR